jgi:hypothetical protein
MGFGLRVLGLLDGPTMRHFPQNPKPKTQNRGYPACSLRLCASARACSAVVLCLVLSACGNPRRDGVPAPQPEQPTARPETPAAVLSSARKAEDRFRTTRVLRVQELTAEGTVEALAREVTLTRVLRVDESGRILAVERSWEESATRLTRDGGPPEESRGELDGCTLELTQRAAGVDASVIAGDVRIGRAQFVIEGFDTGVLPRDPVRRGDRWQVTGPALVAVARFLEGMLQRVETNRLECVVTDVQPEHVEIALDWRITAELNRRPAVLRFTGRLVFDREARLITEFALTGGSGDERRIEISVKRRMVEGWLDFDE